MELSVLVHGAMFTAAMRAVEDDYRSNSREVVLEEWLRRPRRERIDKSDAADILPAVTSRSTSAVRSRSGKSLHSHQAQLI